LNGEKDIFNLGPKREDFKEGYKGENYWYIPTWRGLMGTWKGGYPGRRLY